MNKRTFLTALGSAIVAVTAGCAEKSTEETMSELDNIETIEVDSGFESGKCIRFVDEEAGMLIYMQVGAMGIKSGGMAAVPIGESLL